MLLILVECRGIFVTAERLWNVILIGLLTRETFSHAWLNESKLKVSFNLNKATLIYHPIRERTTEILASTELNLYDSLRRRERDSGVSRDIVWRILKNNKFYPYRMSVQQALNYNDFRQRFAFCNWIRQQPQDFHLKILFFDKCTFKSDGLLILGTLVIEFRTN